VSVTNNINVPIQVGDTSSPYNLPTNGSNNLGDMNGQDNPIDLWWQQVKSYAALAMERLKNGVEAVKEFLSSLTTDERWGVMLAFEEAQPQMFSQLVAEAPNWVEWMA
jgi:hypothetical protein